MDCCHISLLVMHIIWEDRLLFADHQKCEQVFESLCAGLLHKGVGWRLKHPHNFQLQFSSESHHKLWLKRDKKVRLEMPKWEAKVNGPAYKCWKLFWGVKGGGEMSVLDHCPREGLREGDPSLEIVLNVWGFFDALDATLYLCNFISVISKFIENVWHFIEEAW